MRHINHKNIIKTSDFIKDEEMGVYIIIMEYFPSIPLETFLKIHQTKNEDQLLLCQEIFEALLFLHENFIAHRDFTASNILVNPETFEIKIIDFGLSRRNFDVSEPYAPEGNMKYRAPSLEIFQNLDAADMWSLGLIFLSVFYKKSIKK